MASPTLGRLCPLGNSRYSFDRRLSGPQNQSGHEDVKKNLHPSDTRDRTRAIQPQPSPLPLEPPGPLEIEPGSSVMVVGHVNQLEMQNFEILYVHSKRKRKIKRTRHSKKRTTVYNDSLKASIDKETFDWVIACELTMPN